MIGGETMPAIDTITIRGFKSIKSVERLKINPINVLIGANGSGKSNFLEALVLARGAGREPDNLHNFVAKAGGAERLLHFGSRTTARLEILAQFKDGNRDGPILEPDSNDSLRVVKTTDAKGQKAFYDPGRQRYFESWRRYHFHDAGPASPMKKTADLHDNRLLRTDGSNLAAFLYLLKQKHPNSYLRIRRIVEQTAPFFDDFALSPQALNEEKILLEWQHKGSDAYFNAASLSDGTLRFIALATLLRQPEELRPPVILLDEPELSLHPHAITLLAAMVKSASVDSQVIMATQSTNLLDHFNPEDVIVANWVNGETRFDRLDAERLDVWLEDYSLGQLWEKNEFGGRPAPEYRPVPR